jgi:ribosomal protein S18 acetylase RimI-like enzyme
MQSQPNNIVENKTGRSEVRTAQKKDQDRIVDTIVLSFASDPFARWVFPEPHQFLSYGGKLTKGFGEKAFEHNTAHYIADFAGAALWLPPGVEPDEELLVNIIEASVDPRRFKIFMSILEQMGSYHPPEPHWYLPLIGVEPTRQRCGYGSAMLSYALEQIDKEGKPAYLESTNPENKGLYERYGFEVIGNIQVDDAPPLIPMLRYPR